MMLKLSTFSVAMTLVILSYSVNADKCEIAEIDCEDKRGPVVFLIEYELQSLATDNDSFASGNYCSINFNKGPLQGSLHLSWTSCRGEYCKLKSLSIITIAYISDHMFNSDIENTWTLCLAYKSLNRTSTNLMLIKKSSAYLDLSGNEIYEFPNGFMCGLLHLNRLYLNRTLLNDTGKLGFLSSDQCHYDICCLCELTHLDLGQNNFNMVKNHTFCGMKKLINLNLSSCNIETIDAKAFTFILTLIKLDLTNNLLSSLHRNVFEELSNLEFLDLSDNLFATFSSPLISTSLFIRSLLLANNEIYDLSADVITRHLKKLDLRNNKWIFDESIFSNNNDLQYLDLSYNCLDNITSTSLTSLLNLQTLLIPNSSITVIPEGFLNKQTYLRKLDLSYNKLLFTNSSLNRLTNLRILDISYSFIEDLPKHLFKNLVSLETLLISYNNLSALPKDLFNDQKILLRLDLQNNKLRYISNELFTHLVNLRELNLSCNLLSSIESDAFSPLIMLSSLSIAENQLNDFPVWNLANLTKLERVGIYRNPWSCNCDYVKNYRSYLQNFTNIFQTTNELYCLSDNNIKHLLIDFNVDRCSVMNDYKTILGTVFGVLLCLTVISVLVFRFRYEMQVIIYSSYGVRFFSSNQVDATNKLFDIFVSYSSLDEVFLATELLPGLENIENPYYVCLHHRDFAPGAFISESIIEAVQYSAVTLILLSDNFMKSEWCRFEFKMAHLQMMKDRCNRIIVIIIGDTIPTDLDEEMKLYMKTNTYLNFNDKLFWKKLYFALPNSMMIRESHM